MDCGRKKLATDLQRTVAIGGAAAQLSSVARGGERQSGDATARGDRWLDDPVASCRNGSNHSKVCAHRGSENWNCRFLDRCAYSSCAPKRWRRTAAFGESLK